MSSDNKSADSIPTSLTLLERVRSRDRDAWGLFCELYTPVIYRWACLTGLQEADAADITQDVLVLVSEKLETFRRENSGQSLRAWIRTIARNKARDLFRARQRQAVAAGGTDAQVMLRNLSHEGPDTESEEAEEGFDAEAAIIHGAAILLKPQFEEHTWQAFQQTAVEGRKASEVAADLNMSVGGVYTAKSRVLARLRKELDGML